MYTTELGPRTDPTGLEDQVQRLAFELGRAFSARERGEPELFQPRVNYVREMIENTMSDEEMLRGEQKARKLHWEAQKAFVLERTTRLFKNMWNLVRGHPWILPDDEKIYDHQVLVFSKLIDLLAGLSDHRRE